MERFDADVCVVGGGVAGLCAAEHAGRAGMSVLLLEARNRLGGRILTEFVSDHSGLPLELGAEFIHGRPPALLSRIREESLPISEVQGKMYRMISGAIKPADENDNRVDAILSSLAQAKQDEPFESFVQREKVDDAGADWATSYIEGFNAADAKLIGTRALAYQQEAEERIGGSNSWRLDGGYTKLVNALAARQAPGTQVMLNTVVSSIKWTRGKVEIQANRSQVDQVNVRAKAAVITVPIGVLRRGGGAFIQFEPIPPVFSDLDGVVMGDAARLILLFRKPVWEETAPGLGFLLSRDEHFPTWWTRTQGTDYLMTAWCGGPKTRWMRGKSKAELTETAMRVLASLLKSERAALEAALQSSHYHDWQSDPFSCGAYSYVRAGGFEAAQRIALPAENTLWFAGEAVATDGHWGTVHGAMGSGQRAAEGIVASMSASY
jgi:monoamine oxidase